MKLIELLVQELPKRGGWPEGVALIDQASDGMIFDPTDTVMPYLFDSHLFELADDWDATQVTREQYEAALVASQPQWNGEGLPPVGCECEVKSGDTFADYDWVKIKVAYSHMGELIGIVDMPSESIHNDMEKLSAGYCGAIFRPIRSEADKKRDEITNAIASALFKDGDFDTKESLRLATFVYGDIAAGKIPHVQLK